MSVKLTIEGNMTEIVLSSERERQIVHRILQKVCTYKDQKYKYRERHMADKLRGNPLALKRYREKNNGGYVQLYEEIGDRFYTYTGFVISLQRAFHVMDMDYEIEDIRPEPKKLDNQIEYQRFELYDYQQKILDDVIANDGAGIVSSPTGSGKTIVGTSILSHYNVPSIVIAGNKRNIMDEWKSKIEVERRSNVKFKNRGSVYVGYIDDEPSILICTAIFLGGYVKKRNKKKKKLHVDVVRLIRNCGLIIFDEVHRAGSDYAIIALNYINCKYRIGLSGTALMRSDGKDLEYVSRIGTVISHVEKDVLIEKEKILPVEIRFLPVRRKPSTRLDYHEAYEVCITYNHDRNDKIMDTMMEFTDKDYKYMVFVDYLDHAREIHINTGIPYTDSKDSKRDEKFEKLREGEINALICTYDLAGEGFDMPSLDALISAGAGKSPIKFDQAKGRIMRVFDGKNKGTVVDFADTSKYFDNHAMERYKLYQSQMGVTVKTKGTWLHGK